MQVATEHAERERVRSRESVKERLLLDRVTLQRSHIASGNHQRAAAVVADLADAPKAIFDQASVRARVAADLIVRQLLVKRSKRALLDSPVELQREGCRLFGGHGLAKSLDGRSLPAARPGLCRRDLGQALLTANGLRFLGLAAGQEPYQR